MDCTEDCRKIYDACKGFGTKEKDIIDVIGRRTLQQRHQIRLRYMDLYREDLVDVLNKELSGDFRQLAKYLFFGPIQVLALQLYKLVKKPGMAGAALNDIICCCNPNELSVLKTVYKEVLEVKGIDDNSRTLSKDIEKETKGKHREYLQLFLNTERRAFTFAQIQSAVNTGRWETLVDVAAAERNAERIHAAVDTRTKTTDETTILHLIAKANTLEIRVMYDHFMDTYNQTIVEFISKHVKKPLRHALNTTIMAAVDMRLLLVAQLYNSLHGLKLDTPTISRIFILRSDTDLKSLKSIFDQKIGSPLVEMVREETSGDYRDLLLALLAAE
nr:unnamed protein product [Spirometra erinaceieuropaei]